jgi:hypothetical protein
LLSWFGCCSFWTGLTNSCIFPRSFGDGIRETVRDDSLLNGLFGCRGSDARMVRIGLVAEDAVVGSAPAGPTNKQSL